MARGLKVAFEEAFADEFLRQLEIRSDAQAMVEGPAPGMRDVTGAEELEYWNERDESVDVQMEAVQLMQQGLSPDKAKAMASMMAYPNRAEMMENAAPGDPEGQAKYARSMRMKSEKAATRAVEGAQDAVRSEY